METAMTFGRIVGRRLALAALCGLLAVTFGAAAAKKQTAPPHVEVASLAALPAVSASAQRYRVGLLVDNQNTEALSFGEIRFTLRIVGQGLLTSRSPTGMKIEALDRTTITVDVPGDTLPSYSQLLAATGPGNKLDYELYGNFTMSRGMKTVPFQAQGVLTLTKVSE
jgi:Late embryogenesis abundant protein